MAKSVLSPKIPTRRIFRKKARDRDGKAHMKEPKLSTVSTTCSLQLANLVAAIKLACVSLGIENTDDPLYDLNALVARIYGYKAALALSSRAQYQKILIVNENLSQEVDELRDALRGKPEDPPESRPCCGSFIRILEQQIHELEEASTEQALELAAFRSAADRDTQMQELKAELAALQKEVEVLRPAGVAVDTIRRRLLGLPKEET